MFTVTIIINEQTSFLSENGVSIDFGVQTANPVKDNTLNTNSKVLEKLTDESRRTKTEKLAWKI